MGKNTGNGANIAWFCYAAMGRVGWGITLGAPGLNRGQYRIIRVKDDEMDLRRMRIADFAGVPAVRQESCKQQTA